MTHSIIYISTAARQINEDSLSKLFEQINLFNNANDITGFLLYKNGYFLQLLEGDQDMISPLFSKIKKDNRHSGIIKVLDQPVKEIAFSQYYNGFQVFDDCSLETKLKRYVAGITTFPSASIRKKAFIISGILNRM